VTAAFDIRTMMDGDRKAVTDLIWELNRFEDAITGNRATDRETAAQCLLANDGRLSESGGVHYVATVDGKVIGYLCAVIDLAPVYIRADLRRHVWIADLIVTEGMRGQGIGKALLAAADTFARDRGLKHILIGVVVGNTATDGLYAAMGYRTYAMERLKTMD
jgi:GNAT superfamily N-acetyltransferase